VFCFGLALLEMVLTSEFAKNPYDCLCKAVKRVSKDQLLAQIGDPELRDFAERSLNDVPERRDTCEELLKHPFLLIKPDDKEEHKNAF
jgi:serine/threonine protein kinase